MPASSSITQYHVIRREIVNDIIYELTLHSQACMHALWNTCMHGSCRVSSRKAKTHKQIEQTNSSPKIETDIYL